MRYSNESKQASAAKPCLPHNRSIRSVAADEGISAATLYKRCKQAVAHGGLYPDAGSVVERWTARKKIDAVLETAAMNYSECVAESDPA